MEGLQCDYITLKYHPDRNRLVREGGYINAWKKQMREKHEEQK